MRNITEEEAQFIQNYIAKLESQGHNVHYPPRDTNQDDPIGLNICTENKGGIRKSDEVHIYWNSASSGSKFDLGMTFMEEIPIVLFNIDKIQITPHKSFENVLLELDSRYRGLK